MMCHFSEMLYTKSGVQTRFEVEHGVNSKMYRDTTIFLSDDGRIASNRAK